MPKTLEGYIGNEFGQPIEGIQATVTRVSDGLPVAFGATQPDGRWAFTDLDEGQEHFVTLTDEAGRAAVRGPWSGELRDAWVRDRLSVAGKPVALDPQAGNALVWGVAGLYVPPSLSPADAYTKTEADARYVNVTGDTIAGLLRLRDSNPLDFVLAIDVGEGFTPHLAIQAKGTLQWSDGVAFDTVLARSAPGVLSLGGSPLLTQAAGDARYEPLDSAYTKAESDALFLTEAEAAGTYLLFDDAEALYAHIDDAYTKAQSDARYPLKTDPNPYPTYLTQAEADALYDPLGGGGGGITQAAADLRYVNVAGDSMAGDLAFAAAARVTFPDLVRDDKILLYTGYSLGIRSGTMGYFANTNGDRHAFFTANVERAAIRGTGVLAVNPLTDPALPAAYTTQPGLLVQHEGASINGLSLARASSADSDGEALNFFRSYGTWASKAALPTGQFISAIQNWAWSGSNWLVSSAIKANTSGTITATATPGALGFFTADAAGVLTRHMRIAPDGLIGVGAKADGSAAAALDVQSLISTTASLYARSHASAPTTQAFFLAMASNGSISWGARNDGVMCDRLVTAGLGAYTGSKIPVYNGAGTLIGNIALYS